MSPPSVKRPGQTPGWVRSGAIWISALPRQSAAFPVESGVFCLFCKMAHIGTPLFMRMAHMRPAKKRDEQVS